MACLKSRPVELGQDIPHNPQIPPVRSALERGKEGKWGKIPPRGAHERSLPSGCKKCSVSALSAADAHSRKRCSYQTRPRTTMTWCPGSRLLSDPPPVSVAVARLVEICYDRPWHRTSNAEKGHYRGGGAPKGNQNAKGNRGGPGRPPIYDPVRFPRIARALAADGKFDIDLAEAFQVSAWCISAWKRKHPEFAAACEVTDAEKLEAVKRSLFHRATGYSHATRKIMAVPAGGGMSEIVEVPYVEHYPPDVAAIRYFLNNRAPAEWRERPEIEAPGSERGRGARPGRPAIARR